MSNIEHWEAEQRERNARALDAELHEAAVQGWAKTAASLQVEVIGLEAQLAGAVDLLEQAVSLLAQPATPDHARKRWQSAVDDLLGDGTAGEQ